MRTIRFFWSTSTPNEPRPSYLGLPRAQWAQGKITVVEMRKFNPAKLPDAEDVILDCPPRLDDQCIAAAKFVDVIAIPVRTS